MTRESLKEMSITEHLKELRGRLGKAAIAIVGCAILSFTQANLLFTFITAPLHATFPTGQIIGTSPTDAFLTKIHIALICGLLLALPVVFYQLWRFITPGLYEQEKRLALPFIIASTFFFISGVSFCFYVVVPAAFSFFSDEFISLGVSPQIRIGEYLGFVLKLLLVFGVVFEMPVLSYFLAKLGLITSHWLWKQTRYALLVIFVLAGILTPGPDVASQLLLAGPMLVLYCLCILVAKVVESGKQSNHSESAHE